MDFEAGILLRLRQLGLSLRCPMLFVQSISFQFCVVLLTCLLIFNLLLVPVSIVCVLADPNINLVWFRRLWFCPILYSTCLFHEQMILFFLLCNVSKIIFGVIIVVEVLYASVSNLRAIKSLSL